MKTTRAQSWDINQLLDSPGHESSLSIDVIEVTAAMRADYEYSNQQISEEDARIRRIGFTQRLIVEQLGDKYVLIGPLLPYLAMQTANVSTVPCIVRSHDIAQVQELLSIQLNSSYSTLTPLVYSRLISRLYRLFPVIKSVSGMNPGIKREWTAGILGLSSSAVLRYSYISKVPPAFQRRCNNPQFPYICFRNTQHFTDAQYHRLLDDLIHYELRSRYQTISTSEFNDMIRNIVELDHHSGSSVASTTASNTPNDCIYDQLELSQRTLLQGTTTPLSDRPKAQMPALFEGITESYYHNLRDSYEERLDDEAADGTMNALMQIARRDGYVVPDQILREVSYQLYCLTQMRITSGQKLLDYACLRSIWDSIIDIYSKI